MKARWPTTCECCKEPVQVGSRITMFAGRTWKTDHLADYKRRRMAMRGRLN